MGKETCYTTEKKKKKIRATRNTCLVANISSFLEREGEGKPQRTRQQGGNIPSAHTTCHLILWLLFCFFDPETGRTPLLPLWNPVSWQFSLGRVFIFPTVEGENSLKWNTHTWYWRRHLWSGAPRQSTCFVPRTQSSQRPAAGPRRWTWGCYPPGSASRRFPGAGRCGASRIWRQTDRWPRSVAWRCARARHPGTWAPWWTGWQQPGRTELEEEREGRGESKRIRRGLLLTFYCFFPFIKCMP